MTNARELRERIAREICNALSPHYSAGGGSGKDAWHYIALDDLAAKPYLLAADRALTLLPAALERVEALEADAARWRWIRQAMSVDGDFSGDSEYGPHAQWLYVDEDKLLPATQEGWTHTVESLVDAAVAATPAPAGTQGSARRPTMPDHPERATEDRALEAAARELCAVNYPDGISEDAALAPARQEGE